MKKQFSWVLLIGAVFSVLAGLYMFLKPAASLASLTLFFSAIMMVNGITELMQFLFGENERKGIILFNGIVAILLSLCLMSSTWLGLVSFIPYMFALWVLVSGFTKMFFGFWERKESKKIGNYFLAVGILGIITGIFLLSHPLFTGLAVAYMIGFGFMYQGVSNFIVFINRKRKDDDEI